MKDKDKIVKSAVAAFLTIAATHTAIAGPVSTPLQSSEKCYGVVKAALNDCATATSSCAGSSTKDKQTDAFIFLPKGVCDKLVGGTLKPEK